MDKKKLHRSNQPDDLKGFEEFLDQVVESRPVETGTAKNVGGESYTFLENDNIRLKKVARLVADKLPLMKQHSQGEKLIENQRRRNALLKAELFKQLGATGSPLEKSMAQVFNAFFLGMKN